MSKKIFFLCFLFVVSKQYAQFQFSGNVNVEFRNATAYLNIVENCNKKSLFLTEQILQESKIDSLGQFMFKGDFLENENRIYKIHIDNCNDAITDYRHLLNHCEDSREIIFIANNNDKIYFPLNSLSQMLCDLEFSSTQNITITKIDSLQEKILANLQNSKSDVQRKNIYKQHFSELQRFSKTFNEPLAELYTFHIYANNDSFSREFYLNDLKKSNYYNQLLERLEQKYPQTAYTKLYKEELNKDQYPLLESKINLIKIVSYILGFLLFISILWNILQFKKRHKTIQKSKIDYKTVLTTQEQKVFGLMYEKLNNKAIAEKLFVSLSTVKTHINNIYSKLSISSRKDIDRFFDS
jgi:DNA-binding CsgD family transcriptional regulator